MLGSIFFAEDEVCKILVDGAGPHFQGRIQSPVNPKFRELFLEYEAMVNGQCFTHVDQLEYQIMGLDPSVRWESGELTRIEDLQLWVSQSELSFKLAEA